MSNEINSPNNDYINKINSFILKYEMNKKILIFLNLV